MENPLVSVIIPCYNQGKYLQEAVESVLASTYENIEIIVINDGSDEDVEFLKKFSAPKTKVVHQANQGLASARNSGIFQSNGKYILPLDADDKIYPQYLEKAVNEIENNDKIGIVYCEAEFFGVKDCKWHLKTYKFPNILWKNIIFCSAMFKKSDWEKVGGYKNEMELGCEDWEFWLSLIETGAEVYKIPEVLFYYRKDENVRTKKSTMFINYVKIRYRIIKFHKEMYKKNFLRICIPLTFQVVRNGLFSIVKRIFF